MKLVALCAEGIEDIVLEELNALGKISSIETARGMIFFEFEGNIKRLIQIKTAEDLMFFVKKFSGITRYKTSLRNIRHQSAKAGILSNLSVLSELRKTDNTFSVLASYKGRRDYTSAEIERAAIDSISGKGVRLSREHDILFRLILTPEISFLGLCIYKTPLSESNRYLTVPGSLNPSLANALLKLSEIKEGENILDPMCGTGVIPIEASAFCSKAIGGDIDKDRINLAGQNSLAKNTDVEFHIWDARKTGLREKTIDKVISNLPFEKQMAFSGFNDSFFHDFISEMDRITKKTSNFVFLTRHPELVSSACEKIGLIISEKREIINSGLKTNIIKIKKK